MISLVNKRYWVFDLDGTLTKPVHDFVHIRKEMGISPDADILETIHGYDHRRKQEALEHLDCMEAHYASLAQPASGVIELLELLQARSCKLGILTRNTKPLAELSLQAIGADFFFNSDFILGRDEVPPKPSPAGVNYLLRSWSASANEGVIVGDYQHDLLAGRAATVTTIHVDSSARDWPEETDIRLDNLHELRELIS